MPIVTYSRFEKIGVILSGLFILGCLFMMCGRCDRRAGAPTSCGDYATVEDLLKCQRGQPYERAASASAKMAAATPIEDNPACHYLDDLMLARTVGYKAQPSGVYQCETPAFNIDSRPGVPIAQVTYSVTGSAERIDAMAVHATLQRMDRQGALLFLAAYAARLGKKTGPKGEQMSEAIFQGVLKDRAGSWRIGAWTVRYAHARASGLETRHILFAR